MINIISRSIITNYNRGPLKVVINTLKGLDLIGVPYVVNRALNATDHIWIHDDPVALASASKLSSNFKIIAGPNIYTTPGELPLKLPTSLLWLHPATWVKEFWDTFGGDKIHSNVWPVGIDTEYFKPSKTTKDLILIYNKMRSQIDVNMVCSLLNKLREPYRVLTYGTYNESEYRTLLQRAKAMVWVGRSESQGIAFLEAMSMNVPMLVWDITHFGNWEGKGKEKFNAEQLAFLSATAVPYFDLTCGIRVTSQEELESSLPNFIEQLNSFRPREYVVNNFSLSKQASALVSFFFSEWGVLPEDIHDTNLRSHSPWRNATKTFRGISILKDALRHLNR